MKKRNNLVYLIFHVLLYLTIDSSKAELPSNQNFEDGLATVSPCDLGETSKNVCLLTFRQFLSSTPDSPARTSEAFCTGSIVTKPTGARQIVTAGHCLKFEGTSQLNELVSISCGPKGSPQISVPRFSNFAIPQFKVNQYPQGDYAFLDLSSVDFGNGLPKLKVTENSDERAALLAGQCCSAGFGLDKNGKYRNYTAGAHQIFKRDSSKRNACLKAYKNAQFKIDLDNLIVDNQQKSAILSGDSGGPVLCRLSRQKDWVQVGVHSTVKVVTQGLPLIVPNEKDPEKPKINTDCGFSWGIDQAQLEPSRHDPQQDGPIGFSPHQHRRKLDPTVKDGPGGYKPPSNQILASPAD